MVLGGVPPCRNILTGINDTNRYYKNGVQNEKKHRRRKKKQHTNILANAGIKQLMIPLWKVIDSIVKILQKKRTASNKKTKWKTNKNMVIFRTVILANQRDCLLAKRLVNARAPRVARQYTRSSTWSTIRLNFTNFDWFLF